MTARHAAAVPDGSTIAGDRFTLRAVAMPTEHGGWSLTLEPVLLGLLVAWSWPGLALGLAAMLAFLARTPLKLVLVDRWRGRWLARTRVAARVAIVELLALVTLVAVAAIGADGRWFWLPLIAAAPLVAIELWFDMRSRGRRLLPELAGTVGIGSVAAAIALLDDAETAVALALWLVVAARAAAAIPYARTQVLRGHDRPHHLWHSDLAQALAVVVAAVGWLAGAVPLAAALAIACVAVFNLGAVRAAPRPAKVIGLQQMFFGIAVVAVTAVAVLA
ncbi:MAG: YwiC-like family protein [Acidimicrobiales bacterium]|nr:YwiC-like family protein [Acidimicrobiales bacterium]